MLLCLVVGDIGYINAEARTVTTVSYFGGWRPEIPTRVLRKHPSVAQLIQDMWQSDFRLRPSMRTVVDSIRNQAKAASINVVQENSTIPQNPTSVNLLSDQDHRAALAKHQNSPNKFALFLSHHKEACATEARLVKMHYESLLSVYCFLVTSQVYLLS